MNNFVFVFLMLSCLQAFADMKTSKFVQALDESALRSINGDNPSSGSLITLPGGGRVTTGKLRLAAIKFSNNFADAPNRELVELLSSNEVYLRYAAYCCLLERYPMPIKKIDYRPLQSPTLPQKHKGNF